MKALVVVALLVLATAGAWWALRGGGDAGPDDAALSPHGAQPADGVRGSTAPERLEVRSTERVANEQATGAAQNGSVPEDVAPVPPPPPFAVKYAGWKGERMLAESRRLLAQVDLAALEVARPLLAGSDAQDDVGSVPLTSGILVRDKGRRMVLDQERFPELYRMRSEAVWVAQEGGRRIAAER